MKALKLLLTGVLCTYLALHTNAQTNTENQLSGDQVLLNQPGHIIDLGDSLFVVGGNTTIYLINEPSNENLYVLNGSKDQLNMAYLKSRSQNTVSGEGEQKIFVFSQHFRSEAAGEITNPEILFGGSLDGPEYSINSDMFIATDEENLSQIKLNWPKVPKAEGYLLFREDKGLTVPHAIIRGGQQTEYTDTGLSFFSNQTYFIMAYGVSLGNRFLSPAVGVTGTTIDVDFKAEAISEARVHFNFVLDNYAFLDLVNEAVYVTIEDNDSKRLMHEELITLSDIRAEDLLFDKALNISGDATGGVYIEPVAATLPSWTLEMWLKPSRQSGNAMSLFESAGLSVFLNESGQIEAHLAGQLFSTTTNLTNQWNHLTFSSLNNQLTAYLNGNLLEFSGQVSSVALGTNTKLGQSNQAPNFNGHMGMVRLWSKARSSDQVLADFRDVFQSQSGQFTDLIGQWRFEQEDVNLQDDIYQNRLSINSDDPNTFPIQYEASNFDNLIKSYKVNTWLEAPTTANNNHIRQYYFQLFEEGTGKRLTQALRTVTFPQPDPPVVTLTQDQSEAFQIQIHIDPINGQDTLSADEYLVHRYTNVNGEWVDDVILGTYLIDTSSVYDEEKDIRKYTRSAIDVYDVYSSGANRSLRGGNRYKYEVVPKYNNTLETQVDIANSWTNATVDSPEGEAVPDLMIEATGDNKIQLSWQPDNWEYKTLWLQRDGQLISDVTGQENYTDSLIISGQNYEYSIIGTENGVVNFEQRYNHAVAPNGQFLGYLLSEEGYVLPNTSFQIVGHDEIYSVTSDATGAFDLDGLYYAENDNFTLTDSIDGDLFDHSFELTHQKPHHTDFVYKAFNYAVQGTVNDFIDFEEPIIANNSIYYQWSYPYPTIINSVTGRVEIQTAQAVYMNVYLKSVETGQKELIHVIPPGGEQGIHIYHAGLQEVELEGYLLLPEAAEKDVYVSGSKSFEEINTINQSVELSDGITADNLLSVNWVYPASDSIYQFLLERKTLNEFREIISGSDYIFEAIAQHGIDSSYKVVDPTGRPGIDYQYALKIITQAGEIVEAANDTFTYPSPGQIIANVKDGKNNIYDIELNPELKDDASWHGISVKVIDVADEEKVHHELLLSKNLAVNDIIKYYQPREATFQGTKVTFQPFKMGAGYLNSPIVEAFDKTRNNNISAVSEEEIVDEKDDDLDLQDPVITASKDARNQIFVSWTYPEYTEVTFEVEKVKWTEDWNLNDGWNTNEVEKYTLPGNQRSFVDTAYAGNAIIGETVLYRIRAKYIDTDESGDETGILYSNWVGDYGIARAFHKVSGYVFNTNGTPQPHVWVGIGNHWTVSDAAGYYVLSSLELSEDVHPVINYVAPGETELRSSATIPNFNIAQQVHTHNITLSTGSNEFWQVSVPSKPEIVGLSITIDTVGLTNQIRWLTNNTGYSGFLFYNNLQFELPKADIRNGQPLVYIDSLISNNPGSADYGVDMYVQDAIGELNSLSLTAQSSVEWAGLSAPQYINAFADQQNGWVELHFAHKRRNIDGYIIYRGEEEIGMVDSDLSFFRDVTGVPGQRYPYVVYSYIRREGIIIKSNLSSATVSAEYPSPGNVFNFSIAETPITSTEGSNEGLFDNSVTLKWQYPEDEVAVKGVAVYRELDQIAIVDAPDSIFVDEEGIPETYTTYSIRTYDEREGEFYFGNRIASTFNYPRLQQPVNFNISGYNGLIDIEDQVFDSLKVNWEYYATAIDGFELTVKEVATDKEVDNLYIEYYSGQNHYEYTFNEGFSEIAYTVSIKTRSTREGYTYYSEVVSEEIIYDKLPQPLFRTNDFISTLDGSATVDGKKVPLEWGFDYANNLNYDGLLLTVEYQVNGEWKPYTYEYAVLGQQNTIVFDALELTAGQELYQLLINGGQSISGKPFRTSIQAYQQKAEERRFSNSTLLEFSLNLNDDGKYPRDVTASVDQPNNVTLSWDYPDEQAGLNRFIIYRDGVIIHRVATSVFGFTDVNAEPGVSHLYEVASEYLENDTHYKTPIRGNKLGNGVIGVKVFSNLANPIPNVELSLSATYNGLSYKKIATTDEDGNISFGELPVSTEGIVYSVKPVKDQEYYEPKSLSTTLTYSAPQNSSLIFSNSHQRTIKGIVRNAYCESGCGHDNVSVSLFLKSGSDATALNTAEVKTDENGQFNLSVPYDISSYESLYVEIGNTRVDETGQSVDSVFFDYLLSENAEWVVDDLGNNKLKIDLLEVISETAHLELGILDNNSFPLNLEVAGPGECNVLSDYEFLLRIYDDAQKMEAQVWTVDQKLDSLLLPPYNHRIEVIDVNKKDRFSTNLLDYFRSRDLYLDQHVENFKIALDSVEVRDSLRNMNYKLRYNERSTILVQIDDPGEAGKQLSCGNYDLVMNTGESESDEFYTELIFNVQPQQTINGRGCSVTSGYIKPKFSGGTWENFNRPGSDSIAFNSSIGESGGWDSLLLIATTPNMQVPYTQLLELYYYDEYGSFQGSYTMEILVLGKQSAPGRDVFIVPETGDNGEYEELVPLFVLRDPPGDNSTAFISENSTINFEFERKHTNGGSVGLSHEFETAFFNLKQKNEISGEIGGNTVQENINKFSLSFNEQISTIKKAVVSENLEGYLDGPDADIVVGVSVVMAYGILEELYLDGCEISKQKKLEVTPNKINSTWYYTRSQIQNTINYYNSLIELNGNNQYVQKEGTVFEVSGDEGGSHQFIENLGAGKEMFENLLESMDTDFTPACEMCEFVQNYNKNYRNKKLIKLKISNDIDDMVDIVDVFCKNYIMEDEGCKYLPDVVKDWNEEIRSGYKNAYRNYLAAKEIIAFYQAADRDRLLAENIEDILVSRLEEFELFDPLENTTFGAGLSISRVVEKKNYEGENFERQFNLSGSLVVNFGTEGQKETLVWTGIGAGVSNELEFLEVKYKSLVKTTTKYSHKSTYEFSESNSTSFKTGFTLDDDDDGDHFSIDILHSWTDEGTKTTPYFSILGGRSSCPFEPGTIPRDLPRIQLTDESGELWPTKYYDLDPNEPKAIPIALSSGNQFDEQRIVQVTAPLGANKNGLKMEIELVKVNNYKGSVSIVPPGENYYTNLIVDRGGVPFFEFKDIELLVKPSCGAVKATYWEEEPIYDTLKLEFNFRKPISPVSLSTDDGSWLVNTEDNRDLVSLKLSNYDVDQKLHSFEEIYLEYKRTSDQYWTRLSDSELGYNTFHKDTLLAYYQKHLNTYPEPTFPIIWNPEGLIDGDYLIRATIVHDNGSTAFSEIVSGVIDRKRPELAGIPSPADSLYSSGDNIQISFDESIDCAKFSSDTGSASVFINGLVIPANQYTLICDGGSVSVLMDKSVVEEYDGQVMAIELYGIYDLNNNQSSPTLLSWDFQLDYGKQTPSDLTALALSPNVVNASSPAELQYEVSNFDVYQKSQSLKHIVLMHKRENTITWIGADTLGIEQLVANYESFNDNTMEPRDTLKLNVGQLEDIVLEDGNYDIQIILTGNSNLQNIISMPSITIDRASPELLGIPSPADGVYDPGDEVVLSFNESINCDYVTVENFFSEMDGESMEAQNFYCTGDQLLVLYDESQLSEKLGRKIKVGITEVYDLVGNVTDSLYHEFSIAQFGKPTSSVSLLEASSNWVVNQDNLSLTFTLAEYDLFEQQHSLDSIILEYSGNQEVWKVIDTVRTVELREYFEANGGITSNNLPYYPIEWMPSEVMQDTTLEVRAKVHGEGFIQFSDIASGRIDRISPALASVEPANRDINLETSVTLSFSEYLEEASPEAAGLSINQIVTGNSTSLSSPVMASVDTTMYEVVMVDDVLQIQFDESFIAQYDMEQLQIVVEYLKDLNGNLLKEKVEESFVVHNMNLDGTVGSNNSLNFNGTQLESGLIQLRWNEMKEGIVYYEVERSSEGQQFDYIATVSSDDEEIEQYIYEDLIDFKEAIYYRLKLYNQDGMLAKSKVVMIEDTGISIPDQLSIHPNPIEDDKVLRFTILNTGSEQTSTIKITDLAGAVLLEEKLETQDQLQHSIQLSKSISAGTYILNLEHNGFNRSMRFVIR